MADILPAGPTGPFPAPAVPESAASRWERRGFNVFPAVWSTGGRVTFIAADRSEVRVRLGLHARTRNYNGTIFGGAMYGIVDPVYAVMLAKRLGRGYIVWDKWAAIRYLKPGRSTLYARFVLPDDEVATVRAAAEAGPVERTYAVRLVDSAGVVHAEVDKGVYVRKTTR